MSLNYGLYLLMGRTFRFVAAREIAKAPGSERCVALSMFRAFTGCAIDMVMSPQHCAPLLLCQTGSHKLMLWENGAINCPAVRLYQLPERSMSSMQESNCLLGKTDRYLVSVLQRLNSFNKSREVPAMPVIVVNMFTDQIAAKRNQFDKRRTMRFQRECIIVFMYTCIYGTKQYNCFFQKPDVSKSSFGRTLYLDTG